MPSIDDLMREIAQLRTENDMLKMLLKENGIDLPIVAADPTLQDESPTDAAVTKRSPLPEKITLFLSLFQGRPDVYARRWESKNGRSGYGPACKNEWKPGLCLKPKGKCADCSHAEYCAYDENAIETHLSGRHVLGVYPLLQDDTCRFLAIDFDEENWRSDVQMVSTACCENDIPCSVEISRSGNGAHLWIFFSEPIDAAKARTLGSSILTLAMKQHARLSFHSYDRMFPNQDTMPKGGFGNLIALPLQVAAARNGGSLFVNEQMKPYADQWVYLSGIERLNEEQVDALLVKLHTAPLGTLRPEDETQNNKPWQRQQAEIMPGDVPSGAEITLADRVYIPVHHFSNRAQNQLKRIAAFRNPQYYRNQAMRMPVWNVPRIICCAEYQGDYLAFPRGCADDILDWMQINHIDTRTIDERGPGRSINVSFNGKLREEQQIAFEALSAHDTGILSATTAFGKTVIGAALIAEKKVNTLILVHRSQLMEQWKERLEQFLIIDEVFPPQPKRRGRPKKREIIGLYGANKDTRSGIIDIAMLQSMGDTDEIKPWIREYGMVIVDECHHIPAVSFEQVLKSVTAKHIYGLTATPKRQDGHHPILQMYLGGIRYHVDAKQQAEKRPFAHVMIPRFTGTHVQLDDSSKTPAIGQYYDQITQDDLRNDLIIDDVMNCIKDGRNCLLLSERTRHVQILADLLRKQVIPVHVLLGGQTNAQMKSQMASLKDAPNDKPLVICATGKFIGEGFDDARLDTLFLTMPISWQGTLAQYVGRLHRLHDGKREVRVYDYIDNHAVMLEKMYRKRLKGYAGIGYSVAADQQDAALSSDIIYDEITFQEQFLHDIAEAKESVVIVSPYVTVKRVRWIEAALQQCIQKHVKVTVISRTTDSLPASSRKAADMALKMLRELQVEIVRREGIHQKYAIMDGNTVWYGSINLLSFSTSKESVMRLHSSSIARALMNAEEGEKS